MSSVSPLNASLINALLGTKIDNKLRMNGFPPPDFSQFNCCTETAPAMGEEEYKEANYCTSKKGCC